MKDLYKAGLLFAVAVLLYSCDKFTDVHKEFIKNGEIVYAPKPDSVSFISGRGRLKMRLWMYNGVNVKQLVVLWNSHKDSLIIPVQFKKGQDSMDLVLENMPEKNYSFDLYSIDNFGNRSLYYNQFGASYGAAYENTILNRRVKNSVFTDVSAEIEWYAATQGMIFTEVRYQKRDGTTKIVRMPAADFKVTAPDAKQGTTFDHRSLFIPESQSIDTFYTAWTTHPTAFPDTYIFSRDLWTALAVSDETASDGGGKVSLLDGNLGTYWHSQWDPSYAPLPHWAVIDMATPKKVAYFEIYRRAGNTDTKTVELYLGNDKDPASPNWALAGTGTYPSTKSDKLTINADPLVSGRYLKLVVTASYNGSGVSSIAEVYAYGK